MPNELSPRLKTLFDALNGEGEVSVTALYEKMFEHDGRSERGQAQRLGTYISRLNDKIGDEGLVVEPGRTKYTYALNSLF